MTAQTWARPDAPSIVGQAAHYDYAGNQISDANIELVLGELHKTLTPGQKQIVYCPKRKILVTGGERAGKSFTSALYAVPRIPYGRLFWFVGPDYEDAQAEFRYCIEMLGDLGAIRTQRDVSMPKLGKWQASLKSGQFLETKSSLEVEKISSKAPDGIVMCEAGRQKYAAYLRCVGRTAEKRGWLFMCGTLEQSESWYGEYWEDWQSSLNADGGISFSIPTWDNYFVFPGGRQDPEIEALYQAYRKVPGMFEERCAAIPVAPTGLVFREPKRSIHVSNKAVLNKDYPVYLAVDPSGGGAPYAVLACQFLPCVCADKHPKDRMELCNIIDEVYETGKTGEQVMDLCRRKAWWSSVKGGAIDVEAPDEQKRWLSICKVNLRSERIPQLAGIRREKSFLYYKQEAVTGGFVDYPHLQVNPDCEGLLYEWRHYKRTDPSDANLIPREIPPSNQPNHSVKALWYLLISRFGYVKGPGVPKVVRYWNKPKAAQL